MESAVLRVDRDDGRARRPGGRHERLPRHDERLLVRERERLAELRGGVRRREAERADEGAAGRRRRRGGSRRRRAPAVPSRRRSRGTRQRTRAASSAVLTDTIFGRWAATAGRSFSSFEPAAIVTIWKRSGKCVDDRKGRVPDRAGGAHEGDPLPRGGVRDVHRGRTSGSPAPGEEDDRRREEEGVEAVQKAAVAREEPARVLDGTAPLERRLDEVSHDRDAGDRDAERRGERKACAAEDERGREAGDEAAAELAPEPLPGLLRAHDRRELPLPEAAPDVVRGGVAQPDDGEQEDHGLPAEGAEADHRRGAEADVERRERGARGGRQEGRHRRRREHDERREDEERRLRPWRGARPASGGSAKRGRAAKSARPAAFGTVPPAASRSR